MAKELKIEYAAVIGSGPFPFDMLRYDFCAPASEEDSHKLATPTHDVGEYMKLRIVIVRRVVGQAGQWTPDRWASFTWKLVTKGYGDHGFDCASDASYAGNILLEGLNSKKVKP